MAKNQKAWANKYWVLTEKWTKAFFISHLCGWFVASLQTLWIVYEIRKKLKK